MERSPVPAAALEPDAFGQPVAVFKHTRPDDFAHAEVYCALATERAQGSVLYYVDTQAMRFSRRDGSPHPDLKFKGRG